MDGRACVYRFYSEDGVLLYVGCTTNPHQRFGPHRYTKWAPLADVEKTEVIWYETVLEALRYEKLAIQNEYPYMQNTDPAWYLRPRFGPIEHGATDVDHGKWSRLRTNVRKFPSERFPGRDLVGEQSKRSMEAWHNHAWAELWASIGELGTQCEMF
jgi:predicted GIY-YIG superfamily endonuclease